MPVLAELVEISELSSEEAPLKRGKRIARDGRWKRILYAAAAGSSLLVAFGLCFFRARTGTGLRGDNEAAIGEWAGDLGDADKPSLFCFLVMQPTGGEPQLVMAQRARNAGIFACEDNAVYSETSTDIGDGYMTQGIGSLQSRKGGGGADATHSWTNVEPFIKAWNSVREDGRFMRHAWAVKADADSVFLPTTLARHLQHLGAAGSLYLSACGGVKFGFYGALEVISRDGVVAYVNNMQACKSRLQWQGWGEDLFAQMCMDQSGVTRRDDFALVTDGLCNQNPVPCTAGTSAFHPFKAPESWVQCWTEASAKEAAQEVQLHPTAPPERMEPPGRVDRGHWAPDPQEREFGEVPAYDCYAGYANWHAGWSRGKKAWCCKHSGRGCPPPAHEAPETYDLYDCNAGFANWHAGWSGDKKAWCCEHSGRGCPPGTPALPAPVGDREPVVLHRYDVEAEENMPEHRVPFPGFAEGGARSEGDMLAEDADRERFDPMRFSAVRAGEEQRGEIRDSYPRPPSQPKSWLQSFFT